MCSSQGNAEAWFHMGVMYLNGWGVKPSQRHALDCFTVSAQVGHVLGMYNLAIMHLNGRAGLAAADAKASCQPALALLKKIAEKGGWGGLVQQVGLPQLWRMSGDACRRSQLYSSCMYVGHKVMLHSCVGWVLCELAMTKCVSHTQRHARQQQAHQNGA